MDTACKKTPSIDQLRWHETASPRIQLCNRTGMLSAPDHTLRLQRHSQTQPQLRAQLAVVVHEALAVAAEILQQHPSGPDPGFVTVTWITTGACGRTMGSDEDSRMSAVAMSGMANHTRARTAHRGATLMIRAPGPLFKDGG